MNNMKKFASILLALVMVLAMAAPAMAEGYSITINGTTGHTYEVYQIFTGTLSTNESVLSDIVWGSGVTEAGQTAMGDAATKAETLTEANIKDFAAEIQQYLTNPSAMTAGTADADGNVVYTLEGLTAGYYLIKDKDDTQDGENGAYTAYILKVVKNVVATPKTSVPEVEKEVKDTNDSTGVDGEWDESADYDIGDDVPFKLTATLGDITAFETYKIVFHDTLSTGLTFNQGTIVVKVDGEVVTDGYSVNVDGQKITITIEDVKADAIGADNNSVITVEYTAKLNDNAIVGSTGNKNTVELEYSNNPNDTTETTTTPPEQVVVFTLKTVVNKVDNNQQPLTGAEFTLEKYDAETQTWKIITVVKNDEGTIFTFSGLDDGKYRLTETTTPNGYNTIDPIYFTVEAVHDATAVTSLIVTVTDKDGTALNGEGVPSFTTVPADGKIETTVVNKPGSTLPETGGAGTVAIYTVGGLLVAAAVVMMISKKRAASK